MVDTATIQEKVLTLVAQQLEKNACDINAAVSLYDQDADELDCIEMVMRLEEQFGIEINDADAAALVSVAAMVEYLIARAAQ